MVTFPNAHRVARTIGATSRNQTKRHAVSHKRSRLSWGVRLPDTEGHVASADPAPAPGDEETDPADRRRMPQLPDQHCPGHAGNEGGHDVGRHHDPYPRRSHGHAGRRRVHRTGNRRPVHLPTTPSSPALSRQGTRRPVPCQRRRRQPARCSTQSRPRDRHRSPD